MSSCGCQTPQMILFRGEVCLGVKEKLEKDGQTPPSEIHSVSHSLTARRKFINKSLLFLFQWSALLLHRKKLEQRSSGHRMDCLLLIFNRNCYGVFPDLTF